MRLTPAALLALIGAASTFATPLSPDHDQYIVKFKPEASRAALARYRRVIKETLSIGKNFDALVVDGSSSIIDELQQSDFVETIVKNEPIFLSPIETLPNPSDDDESLNLLSNTAAWGLERITKREGPFDGTYEAPEPQGEGVVAYVIDTGIFPDHEEFNGESGSRAIIGGIFAGTPNATYDEQGHGSHVAGTIGGRTFGVAPKTTLIGVKVLDKKGSGSLASVIAGIEWAVKDCKSRGAKRCVANMSLGGKNIDILNQAAAAAVNAGVLMVVAAGNNNGNACRASPASTKEVITVAASTPKDTRASFSNWGPCIDIFAPGHQIRSVSIKSTSDSVVYSGTSMASPHVCGAAALYWSMYPKKSLQEIVSLIVDGTPTINALADFTPSRLDLILRPWRKEITKTPNKLLYVGA